jgi:hypothetical protein
MGEAVKVTFAKIGSRRYRVSVARELGPDLTSVSAPGYDDWLPHDVLHFVAEATWEMRGGVFAGLAGRNDTGIFFPADPELIAKWMRRRKRRPPPKPKGGRSELLAHVLEWSWKERRLGRPRPADWQEQLAAARADPDHVQKALAWCDELAEAWHALRVGESLTLEWPGPETRRVRHRGVRGRPAAPRASAGAGARRAARS